MGLDEKTVFEVWEALPNAAALLDEKGALRWCNGAFEHLTLHSRRYWTGRRLDALLPDGASQWTLRAEGTVVSPVVEAPGREKTAIVVWRRSLPPLPEGVFLEVLEVGEVVAREREEAVTQASRAVRELLRNLAHEIKNPLGGIRGAVQLLESSLSESDDKELAQIVLDETARLNALVERFLAPYRGRATPCRVDTAELLDKVGRLMENEFARLSVVRDFDVSAPPVTADEDRLMQVFLNLARNAAQATDGRGVVRLTSRLVRDVRLGQRRVRRACALSVADNGSGIPEALRERLFYPLVTGRAEGSGLGLSIADAFVREAGGVIDVRSVPGNTIFTVLLPYEEIKRREGE